jgi:Flp pilus assembly protein TadG
MLFALVAAPALLLTSMAIDISRINYVQTVAAYSCDAAAMAAGRYNVSDVQKNGIKFFNANFIKNAENISITPTMSLSNDNKFITCTARGTVPSLFGKFLGIVNFNSTTVVQRLVSKSEIALVLDNTGSMENDNKIQGLKNASNQLISSLFQGKASDPNIAVSIVPFVATVNIGTANKNWLTNPLDVNLFPKKVPWAGCVKAASTETGLNMPTDTPPPGRLWPIYYVPTTSSLGNNSDNNYTVRADGTISTRNPPVSTVGPNRSCGLPIQPLTNTVAPLTTLINSMQPVDGGGTFCDLGLGWGWNTISPKWKGLWGALSPQPYGETTKSIVLVTDGENNWYDGSGAPTGDPTAYSTDAISNRVSNGALGSTKAGICKSLNCRAQIDERMLDLCAKIKAQGIRIFTVGFRVSNTQALANLKTCASDPKWAFQAGDNTQLLANFKSIGDELAAVRIIK